MSRCWRLRLILVRPWPLRKQDFVRARALEHRCLAVERAADAAVAAVEHMGADHGGAHDFLAKQFLNGANVVALSVGWRA